MMRDFGVPKLPHLNAVAHHAVRTEDIGPAARALIADHYAPDRDIFARAREAD
jgi:hypothetical protein